MYGITVYFNPCNYLNRYDNYKTFRTRTKLQGLKLITVELTFGKDRSVLNDPEDAEKVIHIKGKRKKNVMWQKERLLNIALENLPDNCTKVCWIDCDIIFQDSDWVKKTSDKLDEVPIVQPYSVVSLLPKGWRSSGDNNMLWVSGDQTKSSYAYFKIYQLMRFRGDEYNRVFMKTYPNAENIGLSKRYDNAYLDIDSDKPKEEVVKELELLIESYLTPGYCWAATRDLLTKIGGFYDRHIVGGGDNIIRDGLEDSTIPKIRTCLFTEKHLKDIEKYTSKLYSHVKGKGIGCIDGIILHMYHGTVENRQYFKRYRILLDHNFDPKKHIFINKKGILEWDFKQSHTKLLAKKLRKYFKQRSEDK